MPARGHIHSGEIPAEAGITRSRDVRGYWIPAFAGISERHVVEFKP
jgi:hypothetical protein